jgi:hypothetical protein
MNRFCFGRQDGVDSLKLLLHLLRIPAEEYDAEEYDFEIDLPSRLIDEKRRRRRGRGKEREHEHLAWRAAASLTFLHSFDTR